MTKLNKDIIMTLTNDGYVIHNVPALSHTEKFNGIVLMKGNYWYVFRHVGRKWYLSVVPKDPSLTPFKTHYSPIHMLQCSDLETFKLLAKLIPH
jgi:hypothetical protein